MYRRVYHFSWRGYRLDNIPYVSRNILSFIHANVQLLDSLVCEDALVKVNRDLSCYSMLNPYC